VVFTNHLAYPQDLLVRSSSKAVEGDGGSLFVAPFAVAAVFGAFAVPFALADAFGVPLAKCGSIVAGSAGADPEALEGVVALAVWLLSVKAVRNGAGARMLR